MQICISAIYRTNQPPKYWFLNFCQRHLCHNSANFLKLHASSKRKIVLAAAGDESQIEAKGALRSPKFQFIGKIKSQAGLALRP
jgi:hypothetical protein